MSLHELLGEKADEGTSHPNCIFFAAERAEALDTRQPRQTRQWQWQGLGRQQLLHMAQMIYGYLWSLTLSRFLRHGQSPGGLFK